MRAAQRACDGDRVRFQVGDASALPFPDASFERTLAILVLNFVPDAAAALREMIRVTRPNGVVAAAVWDYGDGMEMLRMFWDEAVALDPAAAARDERHMPLSGRGELSALWRDVGLSDIEDASLTLDMAFASFDDYWQPFLVRAGTGRRLRVRAGRTRPRAAAGAIERPLGGRGTGFHADGTGVGGAGRRHLTALANCRTSCGSVLMFGKTVCRTSRPSNDRPARSSTRADRALSTWHIAEIRYTFGSLSISASRSSTTSAMSRRPHHRRPRQ